MSANEHHTSGQRGTRLLVVSCALYLAAHIFGSDWRSVPTSDELAKVDAKGQITLIEADHSEWYLNSEQRKAFDVAEVERRNKKLSALEGSVRAQLQTYSDTTKASNAPLIKQLGSDLEQGQFTEALAHWREIENSTSPKTLATFGHASAEKIATDLADLEILQVSQRVSAFELTPRSQAGFLWTSPTGAPIELLALASLGAVAAYLTRRRTLRLRKLEPTSSSSVSAMRHAAGPLLALIAWSIARPGIEFTQVPLALVLIGIGFGFATPYLGRLVARLTGKDLEKGLRQSRSSKHKARILQAMKDLRPNSFADLKRAASQFAAELTAAEVEEHPQS